MDVNIEETISLTNRNGRYQRSFSMEQLSSIQNSSKKARIQTVIVWMVFALFGWYYTRFMISRETTIATKQAPYQQTANGDVILDFTLNEPLVDPPTIPCKSLPYRQCSERKGSPYYFFLVLRFVSFDNHSFFSCLYVSLGTSCLYVSSCLVVYFWFSSQYVA